MLYVSYGAWPQSGTNWPVNEPIPENSFALSEWNPHVFWKPVGGFGLYSSGGDLGGEPGETPSQDIQPSRVWQSSWTRTALACALLFFAQPGIIAEQPAAETAVIGSDWSPPRKISDGYYNRAALQTNLWQSSFATESLIQGSDYYQGGRWESYYSRAARIYLWQNEPVFEPPQFTAVYGTEWPQPSRKISDGYYSRAALVGTLWQSAFATQSLVSGDNYLQYAKWNSYYSRAARLNLWQNGPIFEQPAANTVYGTEFPQPSRRTNDNYYSRAALIGNLWQSAFSTESLISGTDWQARCSWEPYYNRAARSYLWGPGFALSILAPSALGAIQFIELPYLYEFREFQSLYQFIEQFPRYYFQGLTMHALYEGEKRTIEVQVKRRRGSGAISLTTPERRILDKDRLELKPWAATTWNSTDEIISAMFDSTDAALDDVGTYYVQFRGVIDSDRPEGEVLVQVREWGP